MHLVSVAFTINFIFCLNFGNFSVAFLSDSFHKKTLLIISFVSGTSIFDPTIYNSYHQFFQRNFKLYWRQGASLSRASFTIRYCGCFSLKAHHSIDLMISQDSQDIPNFHRAIHNCSWFMLSSCFKSINNICTFLLYS